MKKAVLAITGGTGFVGTTLIRLAQSQGHRIRALTRSQQTAQEGVEWIPGSLDRPESLRTLVEGSDAVIHVAGVVNAPDRAGFEAGNVSGTLAMIEATRTLFSGFAVFQMANAAPGRPNILNRNPPPSTPYSGL